MIARLVAESCLDQSAVLNLGLQQVRKALGKCYVPLYLSSAWGLFLGTDFWKTDTAFLAQ